MCSGNFKTSCQEVVHFSFGNSENCWKSLKFIFYNKFITSPQITAEQANKIFLNISISNMVLECEIFRILISNVKR